MKRFLIKLFGFSAVLALIAVGAIWGFRNTLAKDTYLYGFKAKRERLKNVEGERIVFVGGSSLAFGLDSEAIEAALGRPVVNMGIHASMGLGFILSTMVNMIHSGDVVVLAPEYELFCKTGNFYGGRESLEAVIDAAPDAILDMNLRAYLHLAEYLPSVVANRVKNLRKNSKFRRGKKSGKKSENKRNQYQWTAQGDFLEGRDKSVGEELGGRHSRFVISPKKVGYFSAVKRQLEEVGAKVVVLPPCLEDRQFDECRGEIENLIMEFKRVGLEYDAPPERYRLPHEMFYDTVYHLNGEGVKWRTKLVIEDLKKQEMLQEL